MPHTSSSFSRGVREGVGEVISHHSTYMSRHKQRNPVLFYKKAVYRFATSCNVAVVVMGALGVHDNTTGMYDARAIERKQAQSGGHSSHTSMGAVARLH